MVTGNRRVAIFGATSEIAGAFARRQAEANCRLAVIGRDRSNVVDTVNDLKVRGAADVFMQTADFTHLAMIPEIVETAWNAFGGLDVALIAYGSLPDQTLAERDVSIAEQALVLNFVSPCLLCGCLANLFQSQRSGMIAAITSVAGDRGRKSNYVYGAAKGGLQRYLQGLRHRLYPAGVQVLDIRPGFVRSKMTEHLEQGGPLWTGPKEVAEDISQAIERRLAVLYTPWFWRYIMTGICWLPRPLFHRTSL